MSSLKEFDSSYHLLKGKTDSETVKPKKKTIMKVNTSLFLMQSKGCGTRFHFFS